jgi:hypothetical protein
VSGLVTACDIETDRWNKIIETHIANGWTVIEKYDQFDAGIDYDRVVLEKNSERIEFTWDNWTEGEIKCSPGRLKEIESSHNIVFRVLPASGSTNP